MNIDEIAWMDVQRRKSDCKDRNDEGTSGCEGE
jgi:hypothetical protein